jgi:prepilin-type N-terminal cleavage/methylation domain-containing protein
MKLPKLGFIHKGQKGYTLMEMAIAMAVGGIIAGAITLTIFQVINTTARTSNQMTVIRQIQSAGYWMSSDVRMAHVITPTSDPDGFPLVLSWTDWDGNVNSVSYTLNGTDLVRNHNGTPNVIAEFINSAGVGPIPYEDGVLTFNITVTVGAGSTAQSKTRTYEITPRTG